LAAADAGDPGAAAGHGAAERLHLADRATAAALLETVAKTVDAVLAHPFLHVGGIRVIHAQRAAVTPLHALDQIVGFGIQPAGVDAEDLNLRDRPQIRSVRTMDSSPKLLA